MDLHPLCTLFPRLSGFEFECLKLDIKENGQREPIIVHDGMILDGGNRYRACVDLGIEPQKMKFSGGNIVTYVLSTNLHRRHLTPGQQAAIVACVQDWAKAQDHGGARRRVQGATLHLETSKECNVAALSKTTDRAAQSGASVRTQKSADKLAKAAPELAASVARGEISLPKAEKQAFPKPPQEQTVASAENPEPEYTELDQAYDQIEALQNIIAAGFMATTDEDRASGLKLLADLRKEIKTLRATLAATETQRDSYMREIGELKRQCAMQVKKIKKLEGAHATPA